MRYYKSMVALLVAVLVLGACSVNNNNDDDDTQGVETTSQTQVFESSIDPPAPLSSQSPLEVPASSTAWPPGPCLSLMEPVGNTVCGYVVNRESNEPVVGRPIFLAEGLFSSDASVVLAALDQQSAPQGVTDENGMFYVIDVPSQLFFLMIGDYPQPLMLQEPDNPTDDIMVDFRTEEGTVDLGIIITHVATVVQGQ